MSVQPFNSPKLFQARFSCDNDGIIQLSSGSKIVVPPPGPNLFLFPQSLCVRCNTLAGAMSNVNPSGCVFLAGTGVDQVSANYWGEVTSDSFPLLSDTPDDIVGTLSLQELAGGNENEIANQLNQSFSIQFYNGVSGALTGGAAGNFLTVAVLYYIWNSISGLFLSEYPEV